MATCKECVHYEACKSQVPRTFWDSEDFYDGCKYYKDKSRYIELPCNIGDKVYFIKCFFDYAKQPMCGTVCMIKTFTGSESWTFGVIMDENYRDRHFVSNDIGKTVFLTKEEAESKLKEINND